MSRLKRILVPVDFSPASETTVPYACALADRYGAECTLLHVLPPLEFTYAMAGSPRGVEENMASSRMDAAMQALERLSGSCMVRRELREGDPAEAIVAAANEGPFDLTLMPTRGVGAFRRWFLIGSVTAQVLSGADCPVWTGVTWPVIRGKLAIDTIVCAVDPGRRSDRVLCFAWALARDFNARMVVVHAMPPAGEAAEDFFDESWRMTLRVRLEDRIRQLLASASADADVVVEAGKPAAVVARVARARGAGLVVLGRGESTGVFGKLRANAYEIIRHSPCAAVGV